MKIDEYQFIIKFLQNIPKGFYNDLKIIFRRQLVSNIDKLTLESMKIQLKSYEKDIEDNLSTYNKDKALYEGRRLYKGQYVNFGKYDHKRSKCLHNDKKVERITNKHKSEEN